MTTSPAGPPADPGAPADPGVPVVPVAPADDHETPEVAGLGARLREHRLGSRLTLEVAAARVGLSPAYLSRLETGRRQPSLPVLLGLARAYGTSVSGLLGEAFTEPDPVVRGGAIEPGRAGGWGYRRAARPAGRCRHCACTSPRACRTRWSGSTRARSGCTCSAAGSG